MVCVLGHLMSRGQANKSIISVVFLLFSKSRYVHNTVGKQSSKSQLEVVSRKSCYKMVFEMSKKYEW